MLDPRYWLQHAVAALEMLTTSAESLPNPDRLAAASLLNGLEHFAGRDDWRSVTLADLTRYSSLMGEKFTQCCTCGRSGGSGL